MGHNNNIGSTLVLGLVLFTWASDPSLACGWWGDDLDDPTADAVVIAPGMATSDTTAIDLPPTDPAAMARLSGAYRLGSDVPQDPQLALFWAKKAAEAGHVGAMNDLGEMYETGFAGQVDDEAAVHWYRFAAEKGQASAQHSLANMLREGNGIDPDPEAANIWLRRSAEQGHVSATAELASRIWSGEITAKDANEGCFWWLVALKQGFDASPQRCRDEAVDLSDAAFLHIDEMAESLLSAPENPSETTNN